MSDQGTAVSGAPAEVATSLSRGTNWWGAFVIGLAGTILVTGIVPFAVSSMGAAAIPAIALVVVIGLIVCLCMGELAALLPHRTGGMPSYAYESFEPHRSYDGEAHRRRFQLGLLAGLVPGCPDQHAAGGRVHRRALSRPARPDLLSTRIARHARLHGRARHHLRRADRPVHPLLPRDQAGREVRHHSRRDLHGAADPAHHSADLQAVQLPLVEHLGLPLRQSRHVRDRLLLGLGLRDFVERHRHGGGGVLHR